MSEAVDAVVAAKFALASGSVTAESVGTMRHSPLKGNCLGDISILSQYMKKPASGGLIH
jgi:hypothetical protein